MAYQFERIVFNTVLNKIQVEKSVNENGEIKLAIVGIEEKEGNYETKYFENVEEYESYLAANCDDNDMTYNKARAAWDLIKAIKAENGVFID